MCVLHLPLHITEFAIPRSNIKLRLPTSMLAKLQKQNGEWEWPKGAHDPYSPPSAPGNAGSRRASSLLLYFYWKTHPFLRRFGEGPCDLPRPWLS